MHLATRAAIAILLATIPCGDAVAARPDRSDGRIVSDVAYDVPTFEAAAGVEYFVDRNGYEHAASDPAYELRELRYLSGGIPVPALVYRPRDARAPRRPVIVFNRGSYVVERDVGATLLPMFHRLARAGFVVVAPMYRGSFGTDGRDEIGGRDLDDLMCVARLVRHLSCADARCLFLYGESRGGVMALMGIRDGFPARAAVTYGAFTDFDALVRSAGPQLEALSRKIWPDFDMRRAEISRRRSAVAWAGSLHVPLLVMHGGADTTVDPSHARALADGLRRAGAVYELMIFEGDNHVLRANQEERDRRAVAWFRRFSR